MWLLVYGGGDSLETLCVGKALEEGEGGFRAISPLAPESLDIATLDPPELLLLVESQVVLRE